VFDIISLRANSYVFDLAYFIPLTVKLNLFLFLLYVILLLFIICFNFH